MITSPLEDVSSTTPTTLPTEVLPWPIDDIDPSPFQERKFFAPEPLQELADSIKRSGIIQPLTVRRVEGRARLELVCGERRLRGGKLAGLATVPVMLRVLSDAEAENIVLTENIQREDLTPSEEARSYERLLKLRDAAGVLMHSREGVAKLASKPVSRIDDHLRLLACPEEMLQAVDRGEVPVSVAKVIGSIPDPKQRPLAAARALKPDYQEVPMSFKQVRDMVRDQFMVSLAGVPWDLGDASLVPVRLEDDPEHEGQQRRCFGGACQDCPMRSGNIEGAVSTKREKGHKRESGGGSVYLCTLPKCHKAKLDAVYAVERQKALQAGKKALDDKEAAKVWHPAHDHLAHSSKYLRMDDKVGWGDLHHSYNDRAQGKAWKSLVKGAEPPLQVVVAKNPHTGRLVELGLAKEVKELAVAMLKGTGKSDDKKTPAELKEEEDRRKKRKLELFQERVDARALDEGFNDILAEMGRKGAGAEVLAVVCEMALGRAGADGLKFMARYLGVEIKGPGSWGLEKPVMKAIKERCEDRAVAWHGMITLCLLSWAVAHGSLRVEDFKKVCGVLNLKITDLQTRAKALLEAEGKGLAKPAKEKAPEKKASKSSTDPVDVDSAKEAGKTAAADLLAASRVAGVGERERMWFFANMGCSVGALQQKFRITFSKAQKMHAALQAEEKAGLGLFGVGAEKASEKESATPKENDEGDLFAAAPLTTGKVAGIPDDVLGFPSLFTAEHVEAGGRALQAKEVEMPALLGVKPKKADKAALATWNKVRVQLIRAQARAAGAGH